MISESSWNLQLLGCYLDSKLIFARHISLFLSASWSLIIRVAAVLRRRALHVERFPVMCGFSLYEELLQSVTSHGMSEERKFPFAICSRSIILVLVFSKTQVLTRLIIPLMIHRCSSLSAHFECVDFLHLVLCSQVVLLRRTAALVSCLVLCPFYG